MVALPIYVKQVIDIWIRRLYPVEEKRLMVEQMLELRVSVVPANCHAALKSGTTMASLRLDRSWWGSPRQPSQPRPTAVPGLSDNQEMVLK